MVMGWVTSLPKFIAEKERLKRMKTQKAIRKTALRSGLAVGLLTLTIAVVSPTRGSAWQQGPVSSTPCPFLFAGLGNASAFTVLELDANKVSISLGAIKG